MTDLRNKKQTLILEAWHSVREVKIWRGQKHILIQPKFSRIHENNKDMSQSTSKWTFALHKLRGLTKLLKDTNRGYSYATVRTKDDYKPELKTRISAHNCIAKRRIKAPDNN